MRTSVHIRATLALFITLTSVRAYEDHVYTNDFAVEIEGNMTVADLVAGTHKLRVVRHVCHLIVVFFFSKIC